MDFLPQAAMEGGPWAILLLVVLGVSFLYWRGIFVSSGQVDRTIQGYVTTNAFLEKEVAYWRAAADRKDETIRTQADQLHKTLAYTAVGTHALESFMKEARRDQVDNRAT